MEVAGPLRRGRTQEGGLETLSQKNRTRCKNSGSSHLVYVDVVVVRGVVDGFEETLELTRGSAVDHQDEGDAYRRRLGSVCGVLVPLYVHVSLTWTETKRTSAQETLRT